MRFLPSNLHFVLIPNKVTHKYQTMTSYYHGVDTVVQSHEFDQLYTVLLQVQLSLFESEVIGLYKQFC